MSQSSQPSVRLIHSFVTTLSPMKKSSSATQTILTVLRKPFRVSFGKWHSSAWYFESSDAVSSVGTNSGTNSPMVSCIVQLSKRHCCVNEAIFSACLHWQAASASEQPTLARAFTIHGTFNNQHSSLQLQLCLQARSQLHLRLGIRSHLSLSEI
jgi:hypothetical protein